MLPVNEDNKMVSPPITLLHILTDYKLAEWPANQKVHVFNCDVFLFQVYKARFIIMIHAFNKPDVQTPLQL